MPSAAPTGAATPTPTPATTATPAAFDLTNGTVLRRFDFKGIGGLHYDRNGDALFVIDAINTNVTPRRYMLRKFKADGTFESAIDLQPSGEKAPDLIGGVAFDLRGVPYFTYHEDKRFRLYKLFTATVALANRLPVSSMEKTGTSAIGADKDVMTLGVLRYDPDRTDTTIRNVVYVRAQEDETPEASYNITDPLEPTIHMAVGPGGILYLVGPKKDGGFAIKSLDKNQAVKDVIGSLDKLPDHFWVGRDGALLLGFDTTGNTPATLRKYDPAGGLLGQTDVKLADGSYLFNLSALTFDGQGRALIAGLGYDPSKNSIEGLFVFP